MLAAAHALRASLHAAVTASATAATTSTASAAAAGVVAVGAGRPVLGLWRGAAKAAAPAAKTAAKPAGGAKAGGAGGKPAAAAAGATGKAAAAAQVRKPVVNMALRTGLIGCKVGMTHTWTEWGDRIPLTAIQIVDNEVIGVRTKEKHGYTALQIGAINETRASKVNKAMAGFFASASVQPKKEISEFKVSPDAVLPAGTKLGCTHFVAGQYVDVVGRTIGKGFAGPMKRHNMKGGRASHGATLQHRKIGSIGAGGDPARVWPGKRMAGHMGNVNTRHPRLLVYKVDPRWGLLYVKGNVPGHEDTLIRIVDSNNMRTAEIKLPVPTAAADAATDVQIAPKEKFNPLTLVRS
eukprot:m.85619 g.85619  ORF g.85619 m.85619 type:complete len:351 (+) comp15061_c0_seq1:159-1211(+)